MKLNATKFFAFAAIAGIAFTACKKSNSNNGPVTASLNGSGFNAKTATGIHYTNSSEFDVTALQINKSDTAIVDLWFGDKFTIGKAFTSDTTDLDLSYYPTFASFSNSVSGNWYDSYYSNSVSTVTITSWDQTKKTISGTFSGNATSDTNSSDSVIIKSGKFNLTYTEQ